MPASEARIRANQQNALKSAGPRTPEGKERSRANSYKHGLTGAGVVMPEEEAAEVERRARAFLDELKPPGEVGEQLARRMATLAVRMDRSVRHEHAAISRRVRDALGQFEAPEGADAETVETLRDEAAGLALFDASEEATLARRYEAAAERGFFRALKELRQLKRDANAVDPVADAPAPRDMMGSYLLLEKEVAKLEARMPKPASYCSPKVPDTFLPADFSTLGRRVDVPISIGKRR